LDHFKQFLIERLQKKGMEPYLIPPFLDNLSKSLGAEPKESRFQLNERLNLLGWGEIDLDYRTLELATVCFESDRLNEM